MTTLQQDMQTLACCHSGSILNPTQDVSAQQRFDTMYISSRQIAEQLGVTRQAVVLAFKRGVLPAPIVVSSDKLHLWERAEVQPAIDAWKMSIDLRRGVKVTIQTGLHRCASGRDGECAHTLCPQLRDKEPATSGRHCPLDVGADDGV